MNFRDMKFLSAGMFFAGFIFSAFQTGKFQAHFLFWAFLYAGLLQAAEYYFGD